MKKRELKKLLAKDIEKALNELDNLLEDNEMYNEFLTLWSRFNLLKKEFTSNTIPKNERDLEYNRLITSILGLIDKTELENKSKEEESSSNTNDEKVVQIQYLKFCHLKKKKENAIPAYRRFVNRLSKEIDIYDEAMAISISKKNKPIDDFVNHSRGTGILEVISSYPWKDEFAEDDFGLNLIKEFVKFRIFEFSDIFFSTTNYYNSFQDNVEDYGHQADDDKDFLILILDFTSVNYKQLINPNATARRIHKGKEKDISEDLLFKNGLFKVEAKNLKKGETVRIDFKIKWENNS